MNPNSQFETTDIIKQGIKRRIVNKNINFNLNGISEVQCTLSDHTPTPTRFIRNCEEVGLFQDLQNVNPFEEGFRKALNCTTTSKKQLVTGKSSSVNDDTLHTPKIIYNAYALADAAESSDEPNALDPLDKSFSDDDSGFELKIISDDKSEHEENDQEITPTPSTSNLSEIKTVTAKYQAECKKKDIAKSISIISRDSKERRRETNRNAARRAYKRRIEAALENQKEVERLRQENDKLKHDNLALSMEVTSLRRQLKAVTSNDTLGQSISSNKSPNLTSAETAIDTHQATKPRTILPKIPLVTITPQFITASNKIDSSARLNNVISVQIITKTNK